VEPATYGYRNFPLLAEDPGGSPSVGDPDPGSGAFLTPGSGIGKKSGSGMNNLDHISESFETLEFFDADPRWKLSDSGSGMGNIRIREPG
jgi:hypothetical protein